ncbi:pickpocket protein 28-like [Photinus pyralis]|uniref:pickpocket protein 28-like n=1 Tax=Photinus pyralis TaxID=7054 RepID=UPI0012672300|nr:pickpocket protein 28-like [Photinus pyralis]
MTQKEKEANGSYKRNLISVSPVSSEISPPKPDFFTHLKRYCIHYCESTTVHGVKYVGERGRHVLEKLAWTAVVFVVCVFCIMLIHKTYQKWQLSPVIVTFASQETPISQIPFPAVTLCPEAKFDPEVFNFTHAMLMEQSGLKLNKQDKEYLQLSYLVCSSAMDYIDLFNTTLWNKTCSPEAIDKLGDEMLPYFDVLGMTTVKWIGKSLNLNESLGISVTSEGFCYTFNMLPYEEILRYSDNFNNSMKPKNKSRKWSLEEGYPPGETFDAFPRRTFMPGLDGGLTIDNIYVNNSHLDYLCGESLQGFKVALHHPSEFPSMDRHFRLPLNQAVVVAIKPQMITVSPQLWNYSPKDRRCYFANERYLESYKMYTQQNCLQECVANYTFAQCKCIPFYYASPEEKITICGPANNECVRQSKLKYLEIESSNGKESEQCDCLPLCTSLSYEVETSQTDWSWHNVLNILNHVKGLNRIRTDLDPKRAHFSKLTVYYKDLQFMTCVRNELYGLVDFFSNMGGLTGLFIGFSVVSAIEIVYFCTLRIWGNIRKYGQNAWSGEPAT